MHIVACIVAIVIVVVALIVVVHDYLKIRELKKLEFKKIRNPERFKIVDGRIELVDLGHGVSEPVNPNWYTPKKKDGFSVYGKTKV